MPAKIQTPDLSLVSDRVIPFTIEPTNKQQMRQREKIIMFYRPGMEVLNTLWRTGTCNDFMEFAMRRKMKWLRRWDLKYGTGCTCKGGKLKRQNTQRRKIRKSITELNVAINALSKLNVGVTVGSRD